MSLDVPALVKAGGIHSLNSAECILSGECASACGAGVLGYEFGPSVKAGVSR